MNSQDFISAVERYVRDAAIEDTIADLKPPRVGECRPKSGRVLIGTTDSRGQILHMSTV